MKIVKTSSGKKIKISKSEWISMGKKVGWVKTAMPSWVNPSTQSTLREENWLMDLMADRVPPDVGIKALRAIDPDVALSLPRVYHYNDNDIKEIDGRLYIITDIGRTLKTKPSYVKMIDIETGDVVSRDKAEIMPQLEAISAPLSQEIADKINVEVRRYNERIDAIDAATSNITLIPLQLGRVSTFIDERIDVLDAIIEATQAKLDNPKPEAMTQWEEGVEQSLLTGDLNEVDFVDTILHNYKYRYDELVRDLSPTEDAPNPPQPPRIDIPSNIDNPDLLRQKLINMGELAFQQYNDKLQGKIQRQNEPGVPFDIESIEYSTLQELDVKDVPISHKTTGYKSYDAYVTSLEQTINSSQRNRDLLIGIQNSLNELGESLGALNTGQRTNEYLKTTPQGREIVDDLTHFVNENLSPFVTQYKNEIVDRSGKVDTMKMGKKGSVGNAFLVVALARLYKVLSKLLDNLGFEPPIEQEREEVGGVVEDAGEVPEGVESSNSNNIIKRLSKILWNAFKERQGNDK